MTYETTLPAFQALSAATGIVTAFALGCSNPAETTSLPPPPAALEVVGTYINTHVTDDGNVMKAQDPTQVSISAMVPGATGVWDTYPGTLSAGGDLTIPDVPEVPYYLVTQGDWSYGSFPRVLVTSARSVDLGEVVLGRPDLMEIEKPTPLGVELTGAFSPNSDWLHLYSAGADAKVWFRPEEWTTGTSAVIPDCSIRMRGLVDGSKGDRVRLLRSQELPLGATSRYRTFTDVAEVAPFTQQDGVSTTLNGALVPIPQQHAMGSVQIAAIDALIPSAHPTAKKRSVDFEVRAYPAATHRSPAVLVQLATGGPLEDDPIDVDFGNFFPPSWATRVVVRAYFRVELVVPWGEPNGFLGEISVEVPYESLTAGPITPPLGPVTDLRVNGDLAYDGLSGVGASPTITWSPPALGEPQEYSLNFVQLSESLYRHAAEIKTADTQVKIIPGVFQPGSHYMIVITARRWSGDGAVFAYAHAFSGLISP